MPVSKLHSQYVAKEPTPQPMAPPRSKSASQLRPGQHRTPFLDQRVREKIQTSMLVNLLTEHVKGKRKMRSTQVRAALGLLAKVLPDLQTIDLAATLTVRKVVRDEPLSVEDFAAKYCEGPTLDLKPN